MVFSKCVELIPLALKPIALKKKTTEVSWRVIFMTKYNCRSRFRNYVKKSSKRHPESHEDDTSDSISAQ